VKPYIPKPIDASIASRDTDVLPLLIEHTLDYAILMLDPNGFVTTWNAGAARMNGYRAEEILGHHFSMFYPAEAVARRWPNQELEIAAREGSFEDEGWRVRKDGTQFWANVIITSIRDDEGALLGFGKVARDLTDRRRAEQQLRESEERFRLMVESTIDYAIFMLDQAGYVTSWNAGAQRIKGYRADEIIGRHFSTFYTADAVASGWPAHELEEAARVGRFEDQGWRVRKDGSQFWANVMISAVRGPDGSLRGFSKVTRDISERREHEQRIQKLTGELEERVVELAATNRELAAQSAENETFVYSVSHDLRAPLVNLQGFSHELALTAESLRAHLQEPDAAAGRRKTAGLIDELEESVGYIRNGVRQLGNIIDGLLRLSRVGRIEYESQSVDVGPLVADVLSAMHATVVASGARIEVMPLPIVTGDRNAIAQIFANIIGNALKSFDEHRPGLLEISARREQPAVFVIRDNGIGIPVEYQSKLLKVFQPIQWGHAHSEGMGLAIVRRIVERHGGRIWFESIEGAGTTFYFTLSAGSPYGIERSSGPVT